MNTKELIALNNEKRGKLTTENEAYYGKILIYVRLKLQLSEHQSEEVLMEVLDHLLEGQQEGKTANDIFGMDPIAYSEQLIEHLPNEKKRNIFWFFTEVAGSIIGPVLIIRGILLLILANYIAVSDEIALVTISIVAVLIIVFIISVIAYVLRRTRISLIKETSIIKNSFFVGLYAAVNMGILLLIIYTLPEVGWTIHFSWWLSIIIGAVVWGLVILFKKRPKK